MGDDVEKWRRMEGQKYDNYFVKYIQECGAKNIINDESMRGLRGEGCVQ